MIEEVLIINAPRYDPCLILPGATMNQKKIVRNEKWALQDAIAYSFNTYLSKQYTLSRWSMGLDPRLYGGGDPAALYLRQQMTEYSMYDCLAVAHLLQFMIDSDLVSINTSVNRSLNILSPRPSLDISSSDPVISYDLNHSGDVDFVEHTNIIIPTTDLTNFSTSSKKSKIHKRSIISRRLRSQKSSIRHRKNRYHHVLIRPVGMTISMVKRKLKQEGVDYINIKITNSLLYIGVKSEQLKRHYDELLPCTFFL